MIEQSFGHGDKKNSFNIWQLMSEYNNAYSMQLLLAEGGGGERNF